MGFPYSSGDVLSASDLNQSSGLVVVKTQTVGSGVSSVTVTNAFSTTFQNYKIIIDGVDCSLQNNTLEFNFTGVTSGYKWAGWYRNYANTIGTFTANPSTTAWPIGYTSTTDSTYASFEVFHPFDSTRRAKYAFMPSGADDFVLCGGGEHTSAASYSGFRIVGGAGTMTGGTIRVYGYNNG